MNKVVDSSEPIPFTVSITTGVGAWMGVEQRIRILEITDRRTAKRTVEGEVIVGLN